VVSKSTRWEFFLKLTVCITVITSIDTTRIDINEMSQILNEFFNLARR
jgi:hypothetical protein